MLILTAEDVKKALPMQETIVCHEARIRLPLGRKS